MAINTIIFDAGGVLFDTLTSREKRVRSILTSIGFNEHEINHAILKGEDYYLTLKNQKWLSSWADEENFFDKYYQTIADNLLATDKYGLKMQLFHHTHYAVNCVLFKEVKAVLESLVNKYKLGVISNAFPSMSWVFDLLDIRKYFNKIILSSEVGVGKPDVLIYHKALEALNEKAESCLFIDDKIANINAAIALGFSGIHLDRKVNDLNIISSYIKKDRD